MVVGTPFQIPKHSNKFGIVSHLASYARVGPEYISDGDSHRE